MIAGAIAAFASQLSSYKFTGEHDASAFAPLYVRKRCPAADEPVEAGGAAAVGEPES